MDNVIAKLKLAPGELGYYDEVSGVYLTQTNPIVEIKAGTNCSVLRRSVKCGRLIILTGSLGKPKSLREILHLTKTEIKDAVDTRTVHTVIEDPRPIKTIEVSKETVTKKAAKKTETKDEIANAEEAIEEKKTPAKKTSTKKTNAKKEDSSEEK